MNKGWRILLFSPAFFTSCLATARDAALDDLLGLSLKELVNVEVSGSTRTLTTLSQTPASVTVFTRGEIQKLGVDFLFELLSFVPGFQTSRDNDRSTEYLYSARGSDTAQGTTAILLLIDGIPRQEIHTASASALSSRLPVDRIERIEVIRGPGSALYGSGAFLGVINIITVRGNNSVAAQAGELNRKDLQAQLNAHGGDWFIDAFLSNYRDDGDDYSLDDRLGSTLLETSDPQLTENYTVRLGYADTQLTLEHLNVESEDFYSVGAINNALNESQNFMNAAALEQAFHWQNYNSQLLLSFSENELDYLAQGTAVGALAARSNPSSTSPLIGNVRYQTHDWLAQWHNDYRINTDTSLQFGMERRHEHITTASVLANFDTNALANRNFPVLSSPALNIYTQVSDTLEREISGLYLQAQHSMDAKTNITLGARYDDYENFDEQSSLRIAVVRLLNETDSLKVFYGEAYRAPSLVQLDTTENVTEAPNPDLGPETIRSSELVWWSQQSNFSVSVSGFYNVIDDRIDASGVIDGKQSTVNQEREYSSGTEIESSLQISPRWIVRAGYTKFFTLPDSAFRESERLVSVIINYQRDLWWLNLAGYYNGDRDMPMQDGESIDGFSTLNFKAGYRFSDRFAGNVQIKNLLDEDITSAPQRLNITTPIPYRGREASIGVSYTL